MDNIQWIVVPLIPSGKHTKNYGKSQFLMGKSTINGPCSIAMLNYQRVCVIIGWVKNYLSTIFGGINIQKAAIEE